MDHSKFIASIRIVHIRVLLITIFKLHVYGETSNLELVIFVLMSHHLSSDAKDSKPLNYINTDIREQNIYDYD